MAHMNRGTEKPKDLKLALKKLMSYCKKELGIILFALILAAAGAILTIAGPNQISKITDYIYDGLTGGVTTDEITADIRQQIANGTINILDYLPEGTDPRSLDLSKLDLSDT